MWVLIYNVRCVFFCIHLEIRSLKQVWKNTYGDVCTISFTWIIIPVMVYCSEVILPVGSDQRISSTRFIVIKCFDLKLQYFFSGRWVNLTEYQLILLGVQHLKLKIVQFLNNLKNPEFSKLVLTKSITLLCYS